MDTKWIDVIKKNAKKARYVAVASFCLVAATVILTGIRRSYDPAMSVGFTVGAAYLLFCFARWCLRRIDSRRGEAGELAWFWSLERLRRGGLIGSAAYILIMFTFLLFPFPLGAFLYDLISYGMEWVVMVLLFGPIACFVVPLYLGAARRMAALFPELLDQCRSREELMEELQAQMRDAVEERVKSERMKIDLITNVSHDLKTPLTSVIAYIELMKKEENSKAVQDYLEVLTKKTEILKNMVENVFELAKASSGSLKLELKVLDMNRLVRQVLADWDGGVREKGKLLKTELSEECTAVRADDVYLCRIVQNLVENAVKYSLDGTRIFVRTHIADGRVWLELINVSNYPIDFEAEAVKARFVRGDKARTTEGNGLGLAIVETFAGALGGSFDIEIVGDTFKALVSFPAVEADGAG